MTGAERLRAAQRGPRISGLGKAVFGLAAFTGSMDILHVYASYRLGIERLAWWQTARIFAVWWLTYGLVLVAALLLARRYPLAPEFTNRRLGLHLAAAAALAYIHTAGNAVAYPLLFDTGAETLERAVRVARLNFPIDFVSYWTIVGVAYAFQFYLSVQQERVAEAQLEARNEQLQRSLVESRLNALRSQLNPHLLFNTLNVISTLVLKGDVTLANRVIVRLGKLLRACLNERGPQLVPLASEMDSLNDYLEIQQLLLGDRLVIQRNIEPATFEARVPSMLLQPLVENSILHGISNGMGRGEIAIDAIRDDDFLRITVKDTGPGFEGSAREGAGIGLSNTSARLEQLYGSSYELIRGGGARGGALITVRIPFSTFDPSRGELQDHAS